MSNWYSNPIWGKINQENLDKYGTTDFEEIERMESYARKSVEAEVKTQAQAQINDMLPDIKKKARENALKEVRTEFSLADGRRIFELSPFCSETITAAGEELKRSHFFPDRQVYDPIREDVRLYFDDLSDSWQVRVKDGLPKLISSFVVVGCLIVNASGPGICQAFVVFLKGRADPLIFWNGVIEASELRRQTQFHQRGLSYARKDLYHESFLRALSMCRAVYFLTLPKHAGWNMTPQGLLVFVNSTMMQPEFEGLFLKVDAENKKNKVLIIKGESLRGK